ncbi:MAG: hypothetical protein IPJ42_00010 [Betaproteobacteria bacterium]|nr:hypothetical protein [Betaproteobacteria bacterium]
MCWRLARNLAYAASGALHYRRPGALAWMATRRGPGVQVLSRLGWRGGAADGAHASPMEAATAAGPSERMVRRNPRTGGINLEHPAPRPMSIVRTARRRRSGTAQPRGSIPWLHGAAPAASLRETADNARGSSIARPGLAGRGIRRSRASAW